MNALTMTTKAPTTPPPVLPTLPADAVTIERIKVEVMRHFNIKLLALLGPQKDAEHARPRMLAMWLCRRLTSASYPGIGREFGGRDHSTVINACRKIDRLLTTDAALFTHAAAVLEALKHGTQLPLVGVH
jgi:chromosomal replication initiation ATPase DnaA